MPAAGGLRMTNEMQRSLHFTASALLLLMCEGHQYNLTTIPCLAYVEPGLQYRRISWYKVLEEETPQHLTGLVLKNLETNETHLYQAAPNAYTIGEDLSLTFPRVGLGDCGRYRCTLWPPVGHKIQNGDFTYYPSGCPEQVDNQHFVKSHKKKSAESVTEVVVAACVVLMVVVTSGIIYISKYKRQDLYKKAPLEAE